MKKLLLILIFLASYTTFTFAQFPGCPNVSAGPDQTLNCSTPCATLTAVPFNAGATTSYAVSSIPHTPPIPYNQPGTGVSVGTDDIWSPVITLPFNFCFYGVNYTQILVGANGDLTFNVGSAGAYCPWPFSATCPSTALNTAGNIFGVYHDIDPSVCGNIKWNLVGTAPCRIFVVSYDQICHFSCNSLKSRHMIVLYETTNAIDVYVESKPTCSGWNSGNALIGIQNPAGTVGVTPPGRNTGPWTVSTPEAWRFLPNGAPIYTVEWLNGSNVIGTGNTVNVCPTSPTTYTARATYTRCDGTTVIEEDQVTVTPANTNLTLVQSTNTPASCGQSNGSFSVNASGGTPGYTFSLDNVTYQSSSSFNGLPVGNYTAFVQDAAGCISTLNVSIADNSTLNLTVNQIQNVDCNGASTGSISSQATGGTVPYSYTINGASNGSSGIFNNLPDGNYTITVTDNIGCTSTLDTIISEPTLLNLVQLNTTNSTCNLANGSLEVVGSGGITPYEFSIDNGITTQSNATFNNLIASSYTVTIIDSNGCSTNIPVTVNADPFPSISFVSVSNVSCFGNNDGAIEVLGSNGISPYSFSLNNAPIQSSSIFNNLFAGNYNIEITDANGCTASIDTTITEPDVLVANSSADEVICEGMSANITGNATGGTSPYTYSWSNGGQQNAINVSPTTPTTYLLTVTDVNGCSSTSSTTITVLPVPTALGQNTVTTGFPPLTVVFDNLSSDANQYAWDFGNGLTNSTSTTSSQTTVYNEPGNYTVTLVASNGICDNTWTNIITVIPYDPLVVEVPNVFSPNDDGSNDYYFIYTENAKSIEGVILDRWGITMVEFTDLNFKWNGKVKEKEAVDGTYFIKYYVEGLDGTVQKGHTFFHLVR